MHPMFPGDFAVEARGVSKSFGPLRALDDISFTIGKGKVFGLLGPNGSGKTTLIRILLGMLKPACGTVSFGFGDHSRSRLDRISYIPEERGLYQRSEVLKLLTYFGTLKGTPAGEARQRAERWLARMGLAVWARRKVEDLSKGMQQRVQFILALVNDPELILLDEPFSGLDPLGVREMQEAMAELRAEGKTFLLSTHQLPYAESLCDDILLLDGGRSLAAGSLAHLIRRHAESVVTVPGSFPSDDFPGVRKVVAEGSRTLIYLGKGVTPREFLNHAHRRGLELGQYTVSDASLQDIFVKLVRENRALSDA